MRRRRLKNAQPDKLSQILGGRIPLASLIQTLAVAEYLNFRHAANALGVAQSSVSARVADDKPVKVTVELPAQLHRDLIAYAEVLARECG